MPFINDILENIWFFQTESVVPIFQELPFVIIILFVAWLLVKFIAASILNKSSQRVAIGLILYPVLIVATYNILIYFGGVFGLDFELIGVSAIISNAIKYWWVFLIFWPVVILKIPFSFFGRKGEGGGNALVSFLFAPIYEELAFRYFAINTIFLLTGSIEMAVFFQAIGFSLIHLPNKDKNGWAGPVSLNFTLVGGLITGIIAVQAGLLIAILSHMIINIINRFVGDFL